MDRQQFQSWLDGYVDAWKTYDEAKIGALFAVTGPASRMPRCATIRLGPGCRDRPRHW